MIQASTTRDPIIRLDRDEATVADAHRMAAPRPPTIAVTRRKCAGTSGPRSGTRSVRRGCATIRVRARRSPRAAVPNDSQTIQRHEVRPFGQDAPHLDRRAHTVGSQARSPGRATPRGPRSPPHRREDLCRQGPDARRRAGRGPGSRRALAEALSALDRAAKAGAIHPNAAARRKSRLTRKVNAALGGAHVQTSGHVTKQTSKAAAAKAAKARIAAGKSAKAKGAQTAAGKARAALSKTARAEAAAAAAAEAAATTTAAPAKAKAPAKSTKATKTTAKSTSTKTATKATATKSTATKATAAKATAKAAPKAKAADKG